jgi:hypothetical protein
MSAESKPESGAAHSAAPKRSEAEILAETFAKTREITRFFLSKIPDERFHERPKAENGHRFNSAAWIMAHLIWTENMLLLERLEGPGAELPWLKQFALGSDPEKVDVQLSRAELKDHSKAVHQKALAHVRSLSDADLDKPSGIPMFPTWRGCIQHAIRHEGNHGGHIGWLVKMLDGAPTI